MSVRLRRLLSPANVSKLRPSWRGFFYASAGLTSIYILLTQGERLDWFHSGVIVGLAVCGGFLLVAAIIRHFVQANPMVYLGFLRRRNIILLTLCLFSMRFNLLSTALLTPSYLGNLQGYRPEQIGPVLAWIALPAFICGILAAFSLRYFDSRLLMASGFTLMAMACLRITLLSSAWSGHDFVLPELLFGIGLALTISGLVGTIVLEAVNSGAIKSPIDTLTYAAWFHTVRLMGGELGTSLMQHVLTTREGFHSNRLVQFVNIYRPVTEQQLRDLTGAMLSKSPGISTALGRAMEAVGKRTHIQAYTMAISDGFILIATIATACLVVVAAIGRHPIQYKDALASKG